MHHIRPHIHNKPPPKGSAYNYESREKFALPSDIITLVTSWHPTLVTWVWWCWCLPETGKHNTHNSTMCAAEDVLMNGCVASLYNYFTVLCIIILQGSHPLTLERLFTVKQCAKWHWKQPHTFGVYHVSWLQYFLLWSTQSYVVLFIMALGATDYLVICTHHMAYKWIYICLHILIYNLHGISCVWWYPPIIPVLERLWQEGSKFNASLSDSKILRFCLKFKQNDNDNKF